MRTLCKNIFSPEKVPMAITSEEGGGGVKALIFAASLKSINVAVVNKIIKFLDLGYQILKKYISYKNSYFPAKRAEHMRTMFTTFSLLLCIVI